MIFIIYNSQHFTFKIYEKDLITKNDVISVEQDAMCNQAESLINDDALKNDEVLSEEIKLKRVEIIKDLDKEYLKKYGLLHKVDLLPDEPERSMSNKCV